MNPLLRESAVHPFAVLDELRRQKEAEGVRIIDLGMGDPRDPTPAFIREALLGSVPEVSSYPTVRGRAALREAAAGYLRRRFGVEVDPERHVLPLNGTKEGIFTSSLALVDPGSERRTVVVFQPAYPVYEAGARYGGGSVHHVELAERDRFRPDPDALPAELLERAAVVWVNLPHNPTGAEGDEALFARFRELSRRHGFVLASDECYADLGFGAPHPSVLTGAGAGFENLLAFHSCSKRSCMTGYRSGFVAGDPALIQALARFRPSVGVATPDFVQEAARAAWSDDAHVAEIKERYRRRRDAFLRLFERKGWHHDGGAATFYLWLRVPPGAGDSMELARRLLELGILATPGAMLGESASRHVRLALVAGDADTEEALRRLESMA